MTIVLIPDKLRTTASLSPSFDTPRTRNHFLRRSARFHGPMLRLASETHRKNKELKVSLPNTCEPRQTERPCGLTLLTTISNFFRLLFFFQAEDGIRDRLKNIV